MAIARCNGCNQIFHSKASANKHAIAAGHAGAGCIFICTHCQVTFGKPKTLKEHIKSTQHVQTVLPYEEPVLAPAALPAPSSPVIPSYASLWQSLQSGIQSLTELSNISVAPPPTSSQSDQSRTIKQCPQCAQDVPIGDIHIQCITGAISCPTCLTQFPSGKELATHVSTRSSCNICKICLSPDQSLQEHYWKSIAHPKCRSCSHAFEDFRVWSEHRATCPISSFQKPDDHAGEQSQSYLKTLGPLSEIAAPSRASKDSSSQTAEHFEAVEDHRETERNNDVSEQSPSPEPELIDTNKQESDSNEEIKPAVHSVHIDRKADSVSIVTEEQAQTTRLTSDTDNSQTQSDSVRPLSLSWHCRSCMQDPPVNPVATICGHIFCHSCIMRELQTNTCCPVCKRFFLIPLHLEQ